MQKLLKYIVTGLIVLAVLAFMTTYSVRFTESAVVTTFGKADGARTEPGMGLRWPYPIQSVIKYDTRSRFVEAVPQTAATKDERQIIVSAFISWRVKDPLKFYQLYGSGARPIEHLRKADDQLKGSLSAALASISEYRLDELLNAREGSKLAELETKIKAKLTSREQAGGAGLALQEGGIEMLSVGIYNIQMPESITQNVFDAMKAARTRIAADAVKKGEAEAEAIRAQADADSRTIMDFVRQRAESIRSQGDREAAQYFAKMSEVPELAVFLKSLELMRDGISSRTTIIWPFSAPGMGVMNPTTSFDPRADALPKIFPNAAPESGTANVDPKSRTTPAPK
jgi:membrane protease subunit HflC